MAVDIDKMIAEVLERIATYEKETAPQLEGRADIASVSDQITTLIRWYKRVSDELEFSSVIPEVDQLFNTKSSIAKTRELFDQLRKFAVSKDATQQHSVLDQIRTTANSAYQETYKAFGPVLFLRDALTGKRHAEVIEFLAKMKADSEKLMTETRTNAETSKRISEEMAGLAQRASLGRYSEVFQTEAIEHSNSAFWWLLTAILLSCIFALLSGGLFGFYSWMHFNKHEIPTGGAGVQFGIVIAAFFSILYFLVIWTSRLYGTHLHNRALNRHRQNALITFQAFLEGCTDDQTKHAILLQAASCIFSPQATGFSSGGKDAESSGPQILEIIRSSAGKASSS